MPKISGYIVAADTKQPIPFATILAVDSATNKPIYGKGTIANDEGEYEFDIQPNQKLQVSSLGYQAQTVPLDRADMVTLKPTATTLQTAVIRPTEQGKAGGKGFASGFKSPNRLSKPQEPVTARNSRPASRSIPVSKPTAAPQKKSQMPLILGIAGSILLLATITIIATGQKTVAIKK